ncbi:MAG: FAD binding domain-containing protein [Candidatus Bathyarchaeia archaeon]
MKQSERTLTSSDLLQGSDCSTVEFNCHKAQSIHEVNSLLARYGQKARILVGGTDLLVMMKHSETQPEILVDISELPELDYIQLRDGFLEIGSTTTLASVEDSHLVKKHIPILHEAVVTIASRQLRNMASLGGNLCNASPAADTTTSLMALDAEVELTGSQATRSLSIEKFYAGVNKSIIGMDELLTKIRVPLSPPRTGTDFFKLGRTAEDIAVVNGAVRLTLTSDGKFADVRIALGAVAPVVMRAHEAEELLVGNVPQESLIEKASLVAVGETKPITDIRASASYRRAVTRTLLHQSFKNALGRVDV